jgi:hypothetical protein
MDRVTHSLWNSNEKCDEKWLEHTQKKKTPEYRTPQLFRQEWPKMSGASNKMTSGKRKIKVVPVFNYAPCHEGRYTRGGTPPRILNLALCGQE